MDGNGRLDMENELLKKVDYVIASMHIPCVTPGSRKENTLASIHAMEHPYVKILGHPDDERYPLDYDMLVRAAKEEQVALEINNSSLNPKSPRTGARENMRTMLERCMRYQVPILLGTDSHICYTIGSFEEALQVLAEVDFPEELVLNCKAENIAGLVNVESI